MSTMIGRIAYPLETSDRQQLRARPAMRFVLVALVVFALCPQSEGVTVSCRARENTPETQPGNKRDAARSKDHKGGNENHEEQKTEENRGGWDFMVSKGKEFKRIAQKDRARLEKDRRQKLQGNFKNKLDTLIEREKANEMAKNIFHMRGETVKFQDALKNFLDQDPTLKNFLEIFPAHMSLTEQAFAQLVIMTFIKEGKFDDAANAIKDGEADGSLGKATVQALKNQLQFCQPDADQKETNTIQNMCAHVTSDAQNLDTQCATMDNANKREMCMTQRIRKTLVDDADIKAICASCQDHVDMCSKKDTKPKSKSCPWSKASNVFNENFNRRYEDKKQNAQEYPISNLFFTQNTINLEKMDYEYKVTIKKLKEKPEMAIDTMPPLTIWRDTNGIWGPAGREYSLDNRRLYMYRMTGVATTRAFFVDDAYLLASHKSQIHKFQKHQNTDIVSGRQCIRVVTPDTDNTTPTESCWQVLRYWSGELAL